MVGALNRMTANLRATANIADEIASGDLTIEAQPLSGKDTPGHGAETHAGETAHGGARSVECRR